MEKLSVSISAFNEEKMIRECLESVSWADEIIMVDNQSSDKTVSIAKEFTKKIYSRPNNPMLNINKNFGFSKTTGQWILCLDPDERVTSDLKAEILEIIQAVKQEKAINGYWIPRKNIIFNQWIKHTGWYPDYQLRLFRNGKGRFPEKHVHEMIEIEGQTAYLKNHLFHDHYHSVDQFIRKMNKIYIESESDNLLASGYQLKPEDSLWFPAREFLSRFFARQGYKDGLHGLNLSLLMSFYHLVVFTKIWEKEGFKKEKLSINQIEKEITAIGKEIKYWLIKAKIEEEHNLIKKYLIRLTSWIN